VESSCEFGIEPSGSQNAGGKRPLGRPRRRWVDNIRMDLVEVGWGDVDWLRIGAGGELS
jgi:hypothetical protein